MIYDIRKNPGLLKLDLYCKGIRLGESCAIEEDGGKEILTGPGWAAAWK